MNAALYARFSTDRQSETSIEDQARLCRVRAAELGFAVAAEHADLATSGATRVGDRPGGRALLADALAGRFSVLLLEGLDRLSRDAIDQETIVRRLEHRGIRIIGVSDGYDSTSGKGRKLLRGVRGLVNEAYTEDLAYKVHRGLVGQIERGYHAGGLSYGYRSVVAGVNAHGEPIGHHLEVVADRAAVVAEIFRRYGAGESCQRIAHDLNARGVRGPRGTWSVSALYGSPNKGSGVLNNELYVGRYIWNRSQWVKDPDTMRRTRTVRPREEWRIVERPELRILTDEAWQAVRDRMTSPRRAGGRGGRGGAPTTLFGGLLRCGCCGGAMVAINGKSYGCAARKDRGATVCRGVTAERAVVDRRLTAFLRDELLAPARLAELERALAVRVAARKRGAAQDADRARVRAAELEREIGRLVDAIAAAGMSLALQERLARAEAELAGLKSGACAAPEAARLSTPARGRLRATALDLAGRLGGNVARARPVLQELFGEIRLQPDGEAVFAEFEGAADRLLMAAGGDYLGRVAGVCNLTRLRVK